MPSPIGHALAGLTVGLLATAARSRTRPSRGSHAGASGLPAIVTRRNLSPARDVLTTVPLACAAAGVAPDLDLLFGTHSTYTHSVGAVALVYVAVRLLRPQAHRVSALASALAWGTHLLLDWLGTDTTDPVGIMALWPFTTTHYQSTAFVFDAISRLYWIPELFIWGNLKAAAKEVLILGPFVLLAATLARRSRGSGPEARRLESAGLEGRRDLPA
ncbi:MAG TPA: metal-dependent hydrolase [Vicinamibacterales bacterium]